MDDDFEAWKLCWKVNLAFQIRRKQPLLESYLCLGCGKETKPWSQTYRSEFVTLAIECSKGHKDWWHPEMDTCSKCHQDFVLRTSKREIICRAEGCRRYLIVDEEVIKERLGEGEFLTLQYLQLLDELKTFDCLIHYETSPLSMVHSKLESSSCNHDRNVCAAGMKEHLELAISQNRFDDIRCPDPGCKARLSPKDLRKLVSSKIFNLFNEGMTMRTLEKVENFRYCRMCPNGQIHPPGGTFVKNGSCRECQANKLLTNILAQSPEWTCFECKTKNCFECYPPPKLCQEHQHSTVDKKSQGEISRTTKMCPKRGCRNRIEYAGGCAHMQCRTSAGGCGTHFCWSCKCIWPNRKAAHFEDCPMRCETRAPAKKPSGMDPVYQPGWDNDEDYDKSLDEALWILSSDK